MHSIKAVSQRTGLSPHVIRVWERRYAAVRPARTQSNRRLYSEAEVDRLVLLQRATNQGHSIGNIAALSVEQLRSMTAGGPNGLSARPDRALGPTAEERVEDCIRETRALDFEGLNRALQASSVKFGVQGLLQQVIAPLAHQLGELWRAGEITSAHEHFATSVIRSFLGEAAHAFVSPTQAPRLIVTTPNGQLHELGALLVYAAAANMGWKVTYLGASLPAAEIAGAAIQNGARAIALSVVYPEDDPRVETELKQLRCLLPARIAILLGGRAAPAYHAAAEATGALLIQDLNAFCNALNDLRRPSPQEGAA